MSDDDLYIGPTLLAPVSPEPSDAGHRLATKIVIPLLLIFLALILVFYVFFRAGRVVGPSMLPTLRNGDLVLLTKGYEEPRRGDIVFTEVDEQGEPVEIVKRVIALPGDMIEVQHDAAVVNGEPEPDRGQHVVPAVGYSFAPFQVPEGYIYVMGDNRPNSEDSRFIGAVPLSGVMGRVVAVYGPITRVRPVR